MPISPINGLPSPDDNSPNDPPIHFDALNAVLDSRLVARFANAAARDAAYASWVQAGNTMTDGLMSHTTSDDRYWTYRAGAWNYAGGAPPPIALCTVVSGWTAFPNAAPAAYKDASGLIHLAGMVTNNNAYTGDFGQPGDYQAIIIPAGYRPSVTIPQMPLYIAGKATATVTIRADGVVQIISTLNDSTPPGCTHLFNSIPPFHPGYNGGALA